MVDNLPGMIDFKSNICSVRHVTSEVMQMGYYYNLARGTMGIILPEGHIVLPEGSIILPEGRRRPKVEAARRQDNAPQRQDNVA